MVSNIGQVTVRPSMKKDPCGICDNKQWQMQYYVNHVQTGYMEDVQRLKG